MNNDETIQLVEQVFENICGAKSQQDLAKILDSELISKRMDPETYPKIDFSISPQEIDLLYKRGVLDDSGNLSLDFSSNKDLTTLEKLLYSVLWKNGDLKKIHNVVKGVSSESDQVDSGIVFHQFGRYLRKEGEPIVDQHILRAFAVHKAELSEDLMSIRKKDTTVASDLELISLYKQWLVSNKLNDALKQTEDYVYYIDQILFAVGRMIKLSKRKA